MNAHIIEFVSFPTLVRLSKSDKKSNHIQLKPSNEQSGDRIQGELWCNIINTRHRSDEKKASYKWYLCMLL